MLARLRKLLDNRWFVRFQHDRSIREALFVFLLTRTLIFFILICVGQLSVFTYPDGRLHDANISFERAQIARKLRETMSRGDVNHYMTIAHVGYLPGPLDLNNERSKQVVFFPLHPLLLGLLSYLTKDVLWAAVVSNCFFFLALVLLYKLTLGFGYDESVARRALFYLAAFPVSYFFSFPITESLFVFLAVASFYAAKHEHWWVAGVLGLVASATRLNGVLLFPSLVVLSWQMYRTVRVKKILGLVLIPFGLLAYMFYCWHLTGDALAFMHANAAWGRKPSLYVLRPVINWIIHPDPFASSWNVHLFHIAAVFLCFFCIYVLARRREWAFAIFTLLSLLVPLASGNLQSIERYTMGFFPVFIALGVSAKSEYSDQAIRFVFVFLLAVMTVLYAANFTNALS